MIYQELYYFWLLSSNHCRKTFAYTNVLTVTLNLEKTYCLMRIIIKFAFTMRFNFFCILRVYKCCYNKIDGDMKIFIYLECRCAATAICTFLQLRASELLKVIRLIHYCVYSFLLTCYLNIIILRRCYKVIINLFMKLNYITG